jgi:CHAT domain-containing protein
LRSLAWDPFAEQCDDARWVFLVPDGELGLINFAALPGGLDTFLVERAPVMAVLGHERDLVSRPFETGAGKCLLALGAPNYDAAPDGSIESGLASIEPGNAVNDSVSRGLDGVRFTPLPGTAAETEAAVELWTASDQRATVVRLTGAEATESAFKTLAPGFRVVHLATHGFFLDGISSAPVGGERGVGGLVAEEVTPDKGAGGTPMLLSGLALAGANRRQAGDEDGILTAEEIATLNLDGVEWAVLSACDSGVGRVGSHEGVFGLRRAFRIAGVRTVIMSLWAVDDEAAREWMTALYRARLNDGMSTAEAVRRANLDILAARRARGESVHPAFWAAFLASGDWR